MDLRIPGGEIVCILNSVNHLLLAYLKFERAFGVGCQNSAFNVKPRKARIGN